MVLYHTSGRVVLAHEIYLEEQAQIEAGDGKGRYTDPIDRLKILDTEVTNPRERVFIVVDTQQFQTLYSYRDPTASKEILSQFSNETSKRFPPEGIDKATFMSCSTLADDVFRCEPTVRTVTVPATYPRQYTYYHSWNYFNSCKEYKPLLVKGKKYIKGLDHQMAYIRRDEIEAHLIPWFNRMEEIVRNKEQPENLRKPIRQSDLPIIEPSTELLVNIHLYNAMLQFGLPRFVQRDVIDALVFQMYQTKLNACHLETLEITVGRFYGRGVAVLDPVINHFIGTYASRSAADRKNPNGLPASLSETENPVQEPQNQNGKRKFLEYSTESGIRKQYPEDTVIVPPELPVLGHCIKHWSGVRGNGSTVAAHTGYPLNVGVYKKFFRRNATTALGNKVYNTGFGDDYEEYSTYRLNRGNYDERARRHHAKHPAGVSPSPSPPDAPVIELDDI
ncbi:uncharacterized protein K460DRAFT_356894 [Cucurbitaria berberidis CBS 394.84]|uniref:Uncharacterized protein n=1 Tax=Cucurbitaria berberidis CBS 394.84 TaxID=1168544 RepID=A0A9P4L5M9_9PLEO|nr:uncharacterized protein K460DRAFT_356894 [Cucurbitaria berberidis CBS 394.84]KAF1843126.1 hypothetical protein K460DRAFT_356894 [Cucurbitaria berberidis CBS 394.84]